MNTPDDDTWPASECDTAFHDAEPPRPSLAAWQRVCDNIHAGVAAHQQRQRQWRRIAATGLAGVAASVLLLATLFHPHPAVSEGTLEATAMPEAAFAAFPMATAADVEIESFHGAGWYALPVGEPHLAGTIILATAADVRLDDTDPAPDWLHGTPRFTLAPGDAPILYAVQADVP